MMVSRQACLLVAVIATTVPTGSARADGPARSATPASRPAASPESRSEQAKRLKLLEQRLDILTDELQRVKEKLVLPEKEELKSSWGLGPAASRIYRTQRGLSMGGYGEFHLQAAVHDKRKDADFSVADMVRYVQYIGYKFTDKLLINVEVEIEHATTGANYLDQGGSVAVEFASLEYLAHPMLNFRAGILLVPMGFINELHEPPFYHGNVRPEVEQQIVPSTWHELGVGIFGHLGSSLTYKLYALTGFNALGFTEGGWRGGRQRGNRVLAEDWAGILSLTYDFRSMLQLGASVYYGGADQNRLQGDVSVQTLLVCGRAQLRYRGLQLRALAAFGHLSNAAALSRMVYPDSSDPAQPETRVVGSQIFGAYGEIAYDLWPLFFNSPLSFIPYVRLEVYDTQAAVPELTDRSKNPASRKRVIEAGVSFKPHSQVVIKVGYRDIASDAPAPVVDSLFVGAGFIY